MICKRSIRWRRSSELGSSRWLAEEGLGASAESSAGGKLCSLYTKGLATGWEVAGPENKRDEQMAEGEPLPSVDSPRALSEPGCAPAAPTSLSK